MDEIDIAQTLIQSKKISERKKGVKIIQKKKIIGLGEELFDLLKIEMEKSKSWEFIVLIIDTLGVLMYEDAAQLFKEICLENKERDMITTAASTAYCRITRAGSSDIENVLELLSFGKFSVVNGALRATGCDRLILDKKNQDVLISTVEKAGFIREKGYSDVRMGLALACAGWDKTDTIKSFLNKCVDSGYIPLKKVAESALKNKYVSID